ncbi:MAG: hypothetical protein V4722_20040 [Bacteroidota bacterium]
MRRPKLIWEPLVMSLLFIPIFILHDTKFFHQEEVSCLKLYLPRNDPGYNKRNTLQFTEQGVLADIKAKRKTEIYLTTYEPDILAQQMDLIMLEMQRLSFYNKSNEVLIVHLNANTRFYTFVELINMTIKTRIKRWAFMRDAFYYLGNELPDYM